MKVNGMDPLIKILLELNNQNFKMPPSSENVNMKNLSKEVEEVLLQRDKVILRGDSILKPEIQFTRQLHETPEAYLQRISSEMIKMKDSQNSILEKQRHLLRQNDDALDLVLRAGLLKEYVNQDKLKGSTASNAKETRWLLIFFITFISLLIIYLIFRK